MLRLRGGNVKDRHLLLKNWLWTVIQEIPDFWEWEMSNYHLKKAFIEDGKKALKELDKEINGNSS